LKWLVQNYALPYSEIQFCPTSWQISKFKPNQSFIAKFILLYGLYNELSMGKIPQNCLFPFGFHHPARGGSSHGHKKFGKEHPAVWEISSRTDRQTCSSQYFATALAGEVNIHITVCSSLHEHTPAISYITLH